RARLPKTHWFWTFLSRIQYDPAPTLLSLTCPVLGIYGELDESTPVKQTEGRLQELLKQAKNQDYRIQIFPQATHSLTINSGAIPVLAPGYLDTVTDWLMIKVKQKNSASKI